MELHITVEQYDKDRAGGWFDDVNIVAQDVSIPEVLRRLAECWEAYTEHSGVPVISIRPITREDVDKALDEYRRERTEKPCKLCKHFTPPGWGESDGFCFNVDSDNHRDIIYEHETCLQWEAKP